MTTAKKLTARQEMFCNEFIIDLNATQAAIRAGYSGKTAKESGYENLTKPHIAQRIAELQEDRNKRNEIDADYVLKRLVQIDKMDVIDIMNDDMTLKAISEWPDAWRKTLSGIDIQSIGKGDVSSGMLSKIKWPDKIKNLELIGKHTSVQAFKDRQEIDHTSSDGTMSLNQFYAQQSKD